jgi:hypothetical protein
MPTMTSASTFVDIPAINQKYIFVCVSGVTSTEATTNYLFNPINGLECINRATNSGIVFSGNPYQSTDQAIMELRRISGLTWDELSELFNVSRRSLHFWASGKPLNAPNEEHLRQILDVIRRIDSGIAQDNRARLLSKFSDGNTAFNLLANKEYSEVIKRLGSASPPVKRPKVNTTRHVTALNTPRPPYELVDAINDNIHVDKGGVIKSTAIKMERKS